MEDSDDELAQYKQLMRDRKKASMVGFSIYL